ncbi:MAG: zinc-binding dehydrogenase, partial [Pseudomonadota bacterium]
MKSKNIKYLPGGGAEIVEYEVGPPGPGKVQVENAACGICSWDIQTFKSGADWDAAAPPGHEGIGYVTQIGEGVKNIEIGQRVCGGGFGKVRNVSPRHLYKIPDSNLPDHHWVVEPASCVVTGVDLCNIKAGERLALVGCGFMGLMMVQILKGMGLDQFVALDIDDKRLALAKDMGAMEVYNTTSADFEDIKVDLRNRQFDCVADTSGSQAGLDISTDLVRRGGRINLFGWLKGTTATFNPTAWHGKGITIVNSSPFAQVRDPFPAAIRLINQGIIDLRPLVTHVVPIEEYPTFMKGVVSGEVDGYIKGVVTTR